MVPLGRCLLEWLRRGCVHVPRGPFFRGDAVLPRSLEAELHPGLVRLDGFLGFGRHELAGVARSPTCSRPSAAGSPPRSRPRSWPRSALDCSSVLAASSSHSTFLCVTRRICRPSKVSTSPSSSSAAVEAAVEPGAADSVGVGSGSGAYGGLRDAGAAGKVPGGGHGHFREGFGHLRA